MSAPALRAAKAVNILCRGTGIKSAEIAKTVDDATKLPELLAALSDIVGDAECETCEKCDGTGLNPRCKTDACHNCAGAGEIVRHPIWPQFLKNAKAALAAAKGEAP